MRSEIPDFGHVFTREEMKHVVEVLKSHPHVRSVSTFGDLMSQDTAKTLHFVVEVDDETFFLKFSDYLKKEVGDQSIAAEQRMVATSYTLGDDLLAQVDASFKQSQNAGNFIDIVIVPPRWRENIDFVQSRLPFDDISTADFINARLMI